MFRKYRKIGRLLIALVVVVIYGVMVLVYMKVFDERT